MLLPMVSGGLAVDAVHPIKGLLDDVARLKEAKTVATQTAGGV